MSYIDFNSRDGGQLSVGDGEGGGAMHIEWHVPGSSSYAHEKNSAKLRQFLRRALARLEKDANATKKGKSSK